MILKKPKKTKRRKKHKASVLHTRDGTCYLCMKEDKYRIYQVVHEHHIFGGPNRVLSEEDGLKVYLCLAHHLDGPGAVHNNRTVMDRLHEDGQRAYERDHTRQQFMERYGRNYLDEEKDEPAAVGQDDAPGFMFLDNKCQGCFGAANNDCRYCEEIRNGQERPNTDL